MDPVAPVSVIEPRPKANILLFSVGGIIIFSLGIALGLFFGKNLYSQPVIEPTPTPITKATPTPNPTANWKTSNNIILGASFKYPNDWVISETGTYTSVVKNPAIATVVDACPGYSLLVSKYDPATNYAKANKIVQGELDGQTTEVWENIDKCSEAMIFVNQRPTNNIKPKYVISFTSATPNSKMVFNQILSTFKFIDQEDSFCGGFAGTICPEGYECKYEPNSDGGFCIKI